MALPDPHPAAPTHHPLDGMHSNEQPQPRLRPESLAAFAKAALKYENLKAPVRIELDRAARGPLLQADVLVGVLEERHQPHIYASLCVAQHHLVGIEAYMPSVDRVELPQLHEHRAAGL